MCRPSCRNLHGGAKVESLRLGGGGATIYTHITRVARLRLGGQMPPHPPLMKPRCAIWLSYSCTHLSPPIATPSYTPLVDREMMLFSSLDMPPDRDT